MSDISAQLVFELRSLTGAGLMDCKKALLDTKGDLEKAQEIIKVKGLKIAAQKSSRASDEGRIFINIAPDFKKIAYVLLTAETDFVAKNDKFSSLGQELADSLMDKGLSAWQKLLDKDQTLGAMLLQSIQEMGENIRVHSQAVITGDLLGCYLHNTKKILTIVEAKTNSTKDRVKLNELLKDVAMHIAANRVEAIRASAIDQKLLDQEKAVFSEQVADKPAAMQEKIIAGKLKKFQQEISLEEQPFLKNPELSVKDWLKQETAGIDWQLLNFHKITI